MYIDDWDKWCKDHHIKICTETEKEPQKKKTLKAVQKDDVIREMQIRQHA